MSERKGGSLSESYSKNKRQQDDSGRDLEHCSDKTEKNNYCKEPPKFVSVQRRLPNSETSETARSCNRQLLVSSLQNQEEINVCCNVPFNVCGYLL